MKKEVVRLCEAFERAHPAKAIKLDPYISIGFETKDLSVSTKDNCAKVMARIEKEEFNKIIKTNALYILEYLKENNIKL